MDLYNYKTLPEDATKPASLQEMLTNSLIGNNTLIASYKKLFDVASEQGQDGLANLAADRMDKHKKHGWMISSSLKTGA
jgi:DNA-binding ferritin-like protein